METEKHGERFWGETELGETRGRVDKGGSEKYEVDRAARIRRLFENWDFVTRPGDRG